MFDCFSAVLIAGNLLRVHTANGVAYARNILIVRKQRRERMENNCRNCDDKQACVPFFAHENVLMHYNRANKRMLVALIVICATLSLVIGIFVYGNTVREKQLIDMINQRITEVENGVHQQPDP